MNRHLPAFLALLTLLLMAVLFVATLAYGAPLTLTWTDNAAGTASTLVERRTGAGAYAPLVDLAPGLTTHVDDTVVGGTTYCYRAAAHNDYGTSPYSNEACATATVDTVTVQVATTGPGTVTSTPAGLACGSTCTATWPAGTVVTLTATPAADATFNGWSGACTGTSTCTLPGNGTLAVGAAFTALPPPPPPATLTIANLTAVPEPGKARLTWTTSRVATCKVFLTTRVYKSPAGTAHTVYMTGLKRKWAYNARVTCTATNTTETATALVSFTTL